MGKYDSLAYVKCPYYKGENDTEMKCEGLLNGAIAIHRWRVKNQKTAVRGAYCCENWQECPIAQALNRKWGYDG